MLYTPGKYDENYDQAADNPQNVPIPIGRFVYGAVLQRSVECPDDLLFIHSNPKLFSAIVPVVSGPFPDQ